MGSCASVQVAVSHDDIKRIFRVINDESTFRFYIYYLRQNNYVKQLYNELKDKGFIDTSGKLTTGTKPFNVFARYASGAMKNHVDQSILGDYANDWMICHNKPENDDNWNNKESKIASMCGPDENGPGHVFITTKNLDWKFFNIITIVLNKDVKFLTSLKEVAMHYAKKRGWKKVGFYFHCFPYNSVNSLHLHVCNEDEKYVGHMHSLIRYKNLPLDVAIKISR